MKPYTCGHTPAIGGEEGSPDFFGLSIGPQYDCISQTSGQDSEGCQNVAQQESIPQRVSVAGTQRKGAALSLALMT